MASKETLVNQSRYEQMHDRFLGKSSMKGGTKYERLAAFVLKSLYEKDAVIHDFKLIGTSKVKHQIDVLIEDRGDKRRVIIECKDFDRSKKLAGLGIIRDFRSVAEDTQADEAFVLTCTGYTAPAQQYAKAKGIKLAVLRVFEDSDWEGYIRQVNIDFYVQHPARIEALNLSLDPEEHEVFSKGMREEGKGEKFDTKVAFVTNDPLYLLSPSEKIHLNDYLDRESFKEAIRVGTKSITLSVEPNEWQIQIANRPPIKFTKFDIKLRASFGEKTKLEVVNDRIAELILKGFGNEDLIIFADQMKELKAKLEADTRKIGVDNNDAN